LRATDDFNTGDNEGVGYFRVNQRTGWRMNTAKAFLRTVTGQGLKVETRAHVRRLIIEDGHVRGVEYEQRGAVKTARCEGELVLSAGAVGSPQILQLSGVGPGALLNRHGIDVLMDQPEIGANLQDHLQLRCAWKLSGGAKTLNTMSASLFGKAKIGLEYALKRSGPMSMAPSQMGAFARSSDRVATADLEYHVQPLTLEAFGQPLDTFPGMTASVCNLRPESRGVVEITSPDYRDAPRIAPNYLATEGDRAVAVAGMRQSREIMAQPAMAKYAPEEFKPGPEYQTDEELARAAGDVGTTIFHPTCTVRMGAEDSAPLDARLRFRGLGGLRVVDASVMPTITSGNTNSPTIMIAEKAAEMMLAEG
jgi:choline dehydrogenase-like flavoprotein